jgi:hypothetical protein
VGKKTQKRPRCALKKALENFLNVLQAKLEAAAASLMWVKQHNRSV